MVKGTWLLLALANVALVASLLWLLSVQMSLRAELARLGEERMHGARQLHGRSAAPTAGEHGGSFACLPYGTGFVNVVCNNNDNGPRIFVITPTYTRATQLVDLTRVSQALQVAATKVDIHWIVVEDSISQSRLVENLLQRSGLRFTHLNIKEKRIPNRFKAGEQRNHGVRFIRDMRPPPHPDSVVYFADDDNAYDARLFYDMTTIKHIGVWPVAYSGGRRVEFPLVDDHGKVTKILAYRVVRKFPLDMAAFAINVKYFLKPTPLFFEVNAETTTGETKLLESAGFTFDSLEPLAENCTLVYVWHVKTSAPKILPDKDPGKHIIEV